MPFSLGSNPPKTDEDQSRVRLLSKDYFLLYGDFMEKLFENKFDGQKHARLGTDKNPASVCVQNKTRMRELESIFKKNGWAYTIEVDKNKPENIADLEILQHPTETVTAEEKTGRNDPCPCGKGKKYKHCCGK